MKARKTEILFKNILWVIFKILFAGIVCFFLSQLIPSSYVENQIEDAGISLKTENPILWEKTLQEYRHQEGLDLPLFYWSVGANGYKDYHQMKIPAHLENHLKKLLRATKSTNQVQQYKNLILQLESLIQNPQNSESKKEWLQHWSALMGSSSIKEYNAVLTSLEKTFLSHAINIPVLRLQREKISFQQSVPHFRWNGLNNQFHQWIRQYLTGDWGISRVDGQSVSSKIGTALLWTISISAIALILAIIISLMTGIYCALNPKTQWSTILNAISFIIFAAPIFWLATLLIQWWTKAGIFPVFSSVIRPIQTLNLFEIPEHYFLPVFVLGIGIWAFLHQQITNKAKAINQMEFILAARMRAVNRKTIIRKYLLPNSIFPIITALTVIVPGLIGGSLIIELIFDIPGMGKLFYDSLLRQDWNIVIPIVYLNILFIIISNLIAEILYRRLDPRLRFFETHIARYE